MASDVSFSWPAKRELFGVGVSVTDYDRAVEAVMDAAAGGRGGVATFLAVHGIVTAATDSEFRGHVNRCQMVAPDGQPVRWALNFFHSCGLGNRVYGPEIMRRVCQRCARDGLSVFLCGSTRPVLALLAWRLREMFPELKIAGVESPPFRPMTPLENDALCRRINDSGAAVVFVGLGVPRQESFADSNREKIRAVQLCVGAAFDFHAGNKKTAPPFMQRHGLEWLFRLIQEPRRLWKRYLVTNSIFLALVAINAVRPIGRRRVMRSAISFFPSPGTPGEGQGGGLSGPIGVPPPPQPSPGVPGEGGTSSRPSAAAPPSRGPHDRGGGHPGDPILHPIGLHRFPQGLLGRHGPGVVRRLQLHHQPDAGAWLSPMEYGAFVTAFAAFLGLGVIHTSLLTEPMLVFSSDRYRHQHPHYFGVLLYWHLLVSLGASLILVLAGWYLKSRGQTDLAQALYWFAVAGPFILFLWLMRAPVTGNSTPGAPPSAAWVISSS